MTDGAESTSRARPRLVDATVAALHLQAAYGVRVTPAAIRKWAQRGRILRHDGPAPFDLVEVDQHARRSGLAGP